MTILRLSPCSAHSSGHFFAQCRNELNLLDVKVALKNSLIAPAAVHSGLYAFGYFGQNLCGYPQRFITFQNSEFSWIYNFIY